MEVLATQFAWAILRRTIRGRLHASTVKELAACLCIRVANGSYDVFAVASGPVGIHAYD